MLHWCLRGSGDPQELLLNHFLCPCPGVLYACTTVTTSSCLLVLSSSTTKARGCNLSDQMQLSVGLSFFFFFAGLHLQMRQMSTPNAHLGYPPSLCPQWKISTSQVQFVFSESRGLSRSDDGCARSVYFCPSAGRGAWGAQGSSRRQQHAVPCKQHRHSPVSLWAPRDPHPGTAEKSASNTVAAFPPVSTFNEARSE